MSREPPASAPVVKRLNQWDWQGRIVPGAKMCEQPLGKGHSRTGQQCGNYARYEVDGTAMCNRHAKVHVFNALDPGYVP